MVPSQGYINVSRRPPDVEDYIDMLRRYRSWILGPTFAGLVIAVMVAFFWPDTYISTAVLRITPPAVPERLVPSNVTSQIAERLVAMQIQILGRQSLIAIIQNPALDLYRREKQRTPMEDIVEDMRKKIHINLIDAPSMQQHSRGASAFQISFSYPDRLKAQRVVQELVGQFISQNLTVLREQSTQTASFLDAEAGAAKEKLDKLAGEITSFKMANRGGLPEQLQSNLQTLNALQQQLAGVTEQINRNGTEKYMLETQLQNLKNQATFMTQSVPADNGPAQAVKNESLIQLNKAIRDLELQLAAARETYKDDHPDIKSFVKRIDVLKKERDSLTAAEQQDAARQQAPAPARMSPQLARSLEDLKSNMATIQAAIQSKDLDIERGTKRQSDLNKQLQTYQARIEVSPANEERYTALLRDYEFAKTKYAEMSQKQELSQTAKNLEDRKAGETLDVLDPASLPEQANEPNRLMWTFIGTGFGLMAGLVLSGIREMKDTSLKNLKDVRAYTNMPVLSSIPLLENALLVRRKRRLFWLAWSSAIIVGTVAMSGSMYYYFFGRS